MRDGESEEGENTEKKKRGKEGEGRECTEERREYRIGGGRRRRAKTVPNVCPV